MILQETLKDLQVQVRNGGSLVAHRAIFSSDSKNLFVINGNTVCVYSTQTCVCTRKILTPSTESIANIALDRFENDTIIICTVQGEIVYASVSTGEFSNQRRLNFSPKNWPKPLTSVINFLYPGDEFYYILVTTQEDVQPVLYSVTCGNDRPLFMERLCSNIVNNMHSVACTRSMNRDFVAAIQENALWVRDCQGKSSKRHMYGTRKLTCVAVHPYEFVCATGDDTGRIVLWANPLQSTTPAKTVFHWHTLPVNDLCFTVDASQILSVGGECTLVKWDLSHTVDKRTLPRLGLPIRHVSVSLKNHAVISHADNSIKIIDAQNCTIGTIQNTTQCYIPEGSGDECTTSTSLDGTGIFQAGLSIDPRSNALIMNGRPGHLQCYSFLEDKHLYELDITQQNYITAERDKIIPFSEINHVAFSKNQDWLATTESRIDKGHLAEIRLRFWKFDSTKQKFSLNTSIGWPHEENIVHSLKMQPTKEDDPDIIAVTTGADQKFKVWGLVRNQSIHGKSLLWNFEGCGSYQKVPAGPVAFARDGSIFAVAFRNVLTLWGSDDHLMKTALSHKKLGEPIKLLEFGNLLSSHLVICCFESTVAVWDVLAQCLHWCMDFKSQCLAVDPYSELVAVFSVNKHAYFFNAKTCEPLAVYKNVSKSKVVSAAFGRNDILRQHGLASTLYFINLSQEVCAFLPNLDTDDEKPLLNIQQDTTGITPFAQTMATKTVSEISNLKKRKGFLPSLVEPSLTQVIHEIIEASPHTMPSISYFCNQLLNAATTRKSASERFDETERLVLASHTSTNQLSTL